MTGADMDRRGVPIRGAARMSYAITAEHGDELEASDYVVLDTVRRTMLGLLQHGIIAELETFSGHTVTMWSYEQGNEDGGQVMAGIVDTLQILAPPRWRIVTLGRDRRLTAVDDDHARHIQDQPLRAVLARDQHTAAGLDTAPARLGRVHVPQLPSTRPGAGHLQPVGQIEHAGPLDLRGGDVQIVVAGHRPSTIQARGSGAES